MRKYILLYLFSHVFLCNLHGQDTLRLTLLKIVHITDSCQNNISDTENGSLKYFFSGNLANVLQESTPIQIAQYGAPGSASLIRAQGLSPDHTSISWNGVPLNSISLGQSDCSLIPIFFINGLSLQSANFSQTKSTSLAGEIVIDTKSDKPPGSISLSSEWTSLGNTFYGLSFANAYKGLKTETRLFHQSLLNNFTYVDSYSLDRLEKEQTHNNAIGGGAMFNGIFESTSGRSIEFGYWTVLRDANLPFRMGGIQSTIDEQMDFQQRAHMKISSLYSGLSWSMAWMRDDQKYVSRSLTGLDVLINSQVLGNRFQFGPDFSRTWPRGEGTIYLKSGIKAVGNSVDFHNGNDPQEGFVSAYSTIYLMKRSRVFKIWTAYESREYKHYPDFLVQYKIQIKGLYTLSSVGIESGIVSRVPDFNERFWTPGGNPELQPEINRTVRIDLSFQKLSRANSNKMSIQLKPFVNRVNNWIQWLPSGEGWWSAHNFKSVHVHGLQFWLKGELRLGKFDHVLSLNGEWSKSIGHNESVNEDINFQMVYTPRIKSTLQWQITVKNWEAGVSGQYIGGRFTDEANSAVYKLPEYAILNTWAAHNIKINESEISIRVRIDNLLNTSYQSVRLYAMPGRVISLSGIIYLFKPDKKQI